MLITYSGSWNAAMYQVRHSLKVWGEKQLTGRWTRIFEGRPISVLRLDTHSDMDSSPGIG